jgi:three-Cys-motif partner protein
MVEHRYGGPWTNIKSEVLRSYLGFFTTALKNKGFDLWYIDGFAGTGSRTVAGRETDLFGESAEPQEISGSARIALNIIPPFQRLIFIEKKPKRVAALKALTGGRNVLILQDDANAVIRDLCRSTTWRGKRASGRGIRAVMFLDPYGMSVDYTTLKEIRGTAAIDLWYLFPLSGLYRQAAHSKANISPDKEAAITRILGSDEWKTRFYAEAKPDLFGNVTDGPRIADVDAIEGYVRERLQAVFPQVLEPLRLYRQRVPIFSLFFAVSNPDRAAWGLAIKGADYILSSGISSQTRLR